MKPEILQTSRQVLTTALTVIGLGLFVIVALRAVHHVSDRQYTEGRQRVVPSVASQTAVPTLNVAANTARYEANLAQQTVSTPDKTNSSQTASPFYPPAENDSQDTQSTSEKPTESDSKSEVVTASHGKSNHSNNAAMGLDNNEASD